MKRGELWWADLPAPPRGSEPGYRRPVLIVSSDRFNASAIATVLVAVITSNTALAAAPGNVRLSKKHSRLASESVINVSQIATLDKQYLSAKVSSLSAEIMDEVEAGLRLVLAMG